MIGGRHYSEDGTWWWDGAAWRPTISPDGCHRWNGQEWIRIAPASVPAVQPASAHSAWRDASSVWALPAPAPGHAPNPYPQPQAEVPTEYLEVSAPRGPITIERVAVVAALLITAVALAMVGNTIYTQRFATHQAAGNFATVKHSLAVQPTP